jgi:hypothetical protein
VLTCAAVTPGQQCGRPRPPHWQQPCSTPQQHFIHRHRHSSASSNTQAAASAPRQGLGLGSLAARETACLASQTCMQVQHSHVQDASVSCAETRESCCLKGRLWLCMWLSLGPGCRRLWCVSK